MAKYPSTLLVQLKDQLEKVSDKDAQKKIEDEIRKADLDLLSKLNEMFQQLTDSIAAAKALIPSTAGFEPLSTITAGALGELKIISAANGAALALPLPATTEWEYFKVIIFTVGTYWVLLPTVGIAVGGTTIHAAVAGQTPFARIKAIKI